MSEDNEISAALVRQYLPDNRFDDGRYLDWQYDENPVGGAFRESLDDPDRGRIAHGAAVPQRLRRGAERLGFLQIVNIVTVPDRQREGVMALLLSRGVPHAIEAGYVGGYGITNDASTGMALKSFGATFAGTLPVSVVAPVPVSTRSVHTLEVTPALLGSAEFEHLTADLDDFPSQHWTQCWTTEMLRWRLARPGSRYWLHVTPELVAVSARRTVRRIPVAVLCKFLPRGGRRGPLSARSVFAAACATHRAPAALHIGFNAHVPVRGVPVPRRLRPAPLNVACLSISAAMDPTTFRFDTFELLDFDAF